jgi:hypothetical protein
MHLPQGNALAFSESWIARPSFAEASAGRPSIVGHKYLLIKGLCIIVVGGFDVSFDVKLSDACPPMEALTRRVNTNIFQPQISIH